MTDAGRRRALLGRGARLSGFVAIPLLSAVSPLIALPAITRGFGAEGWAAVAIGQSFGAAVAVLLELGWGLTGPQRVARQATRNRRQTYVLALLTKGLLAIPAVAAAMVAGAWAAPAAKDAAAWSAAAAAIAGMSSAWFFIGIGRPGQLFASETVLRVSAAIAGAVAIDLGAPLLVYPVSLLAAAGAASIAGLLLVGGHRVAWRPLLRPGRLRLACRAQSVALGGRLISSLYIALPTAIVGVAAPQALALFAAVERLQRMGLTVAQAVPNAMQGWVGAAAGAERLRRIRIAIAANAAFGVFAGIAAGIGLPLASHLLFSGVVSVPPVLAWSSGLLVATVCTSRAVGLLGLVGLRRVGAIASSAAVGAAVGVTAIWTLSRALGAVGGLLGEVLAELAVLIYQGAVLARAYGASAQRTVPSAGGVLRDPRPVPDA